MKIKLCENGYFIQIIDADRVEIEQLKISFTKKIENWFIKKKKNPNITCDISFFDVYLRIPFGLWKELVDMCIEFNFKIELANNIDFYDKSFDTEEFSEWLDEYFSHEDCDMYPYDYQKEAIIKAIKYKKCTEEISTSGGKTFISFLIFQYLYETNKINTMLFIVPNVGLVTQGEEDFYKYIEKTMHKPNWKSQCIYSGEANNDSIKSNIVFGTYQSLSKKSPEFFEKVDAIICDECLHPDTMITMSDGSTKKISDVKVGDIVYTINENTSEISHKEVEYVYHNLSKGLQMYEIEMENGNTIQITCNHKVLVKGNIWKRVDELSVDDEIIELNI